MEILTNPLFYNLLFAHLVADFILQTETMCKNRQASPFGWAMWKHIIIVMVCMYASSNAYVDFWKCAIWLILVSHTIIDLIKNEIAHHKKLQDSSLWVFLVDQALHIGVIAWIAICFPKCHSWSQFSWLTGEWAWKAPLLACIFAFNLTPANVLIGQILNMCSIRPEVPESIQNNEEKELAQKKLIDAGALIGNLERILVVAMVGLEQYEVAGFVIGAKSILRFNDRKSEYVLTGTLLSMTIAFASGLIILKFIA